MRHELEYERANVPRLAAEVEGEWASELEFALEGELETSLSARYEIIGVDTRVRVSNTTAAPFRYICNLEYDGGRWICTGTLIGPSTVLTAGHCLEGRTPSRMRIIPGRNGTLEPLPATFATAFRFPPNYARVSTTDYAVIHLRDPIGRTVGYWTRTYSRGPSDSVGTSISAAPLPLPAGTLRLNLSGYPVDKCMTIGRPPRHLCGTRQYRAYDRTMRLRGGILHYLNDTFGGMSGSPIWVRRHPSMGGRVMIGIHLDRDDRGRLGATPEIANRGLRFTTAILNFIAANTI